MFSQSFLKSVERFGNYFVLIGISLILILASVFQFVLHELPCPLCLLQRIGFICIAFGFLMNLRFGSRGIYYSIILLSTLFTSFVSLRQIALHVLPNTGFYGLPFLGFHLYTWVFIVCVLIFIATSLLICVDHNTPENIRKIPVLTHAVFALMSFIVLFNLISIIFECGLNECPDNPETYKILNEEIMRI